MNLKVTQFYHFLFVNFYVNALLSCLAVVDTRSEIVSSLDKYMLLYLTMFLAGILTLKAINNKYVFFVVLHSDISNF